VGTANAATPSYIGPWKYSTSVPGGGSAGDIGTEAAAFSAAIADTLVKSPSICNMSLGGAASEWTSTQFDPAPVDGVETGATRYQSINYQMNCPTSTVNNSYATVVRRRTVCASWQRFWDNKCVGITEISRHAQKGSNMGPTCNTPHCGQPINPSTGNMWHIEPDYAAAHSPGSLNITRFYNSNPAVRERSPVRSFGAGWTHRYDSWLRQIAKLPNSGETKCYYRNDTYEYFCESPFVELSAIPESVAVTRGDGKSTVFQRSGNQWFGEADANDRLTPVFDASFSIVLRWEYRTAQGDSTERYDANGLLTSITERNGEAQRLTYSTGQSNDTAVSRFPADAPVCGVVLPGDVLPANRLLCVTDSWGRQLHFKYDANGRVSAITDPANQVTAYEYDGPSGGCFPANPTSRACSANNLTKVTYPDGKSRVYYYNESSRINDGAACSYVVPSGGGFGHLLNSMTGLVDENAVRHISWTYDCVNMATSSQLANGVEKVELSYVITANSAATTYVTHKIGDPVAPQTTSHTFRATAVLGTIKNNYVDSPCVECGSIYSRTFDANGNIKAATNFISSLTTYVYDLARNLETSRVEASGTPAARTITTAWHPTYRLPTQIAEPKRLTTYTHDAMGNVLTRTEQATTDLTGAAGLAASLTGTARTWTYTYNPMGQLTTVSGPRSDVPSTTTYAYDAMGRLISVTNPKGHVTTLSNYDAHGRAGQIVAPNGVVTNLSYTPRGWLALRTVSSGSDSETTSYDYDGTGQLKKVTMPDGTWVSYTYDDAHRLTNIVDSLGNSVVYTLDLTGNRLKEKVSDPGGTLRRQISRVFDDVNRVKEQTGGGQ
jgi:YD repeat-containing protein